MEQHRGLVCACAHRLHFDMTRSGARLAWEYFNPREPLPALLAHIEDRDLWRWALPQTDAFLSHLDVVVQSFESWHAVAQFAPAQVALFVRDGEPMAVKFKALCAQIAGDAHPIQLLGHAGLAVSSGRAFASDVGNILAQQCGTFAAVYYPHARELKVSLRAVSGFDVEQLARRFGGGGHKAAAAFRLPLTDLPALLAGSLQPSVDSLAAAPTRPTTDRDRARAKTAPRSPAAHLALRA